MKPISTEISSIKYPIGPIPYSPDINSPSNTNASNPNKIHDPLTTKSISASGNFAYPTFNPRTTSETISLLPKPVITITSEPIGFLKDEEDDEEEEEEENKNEFYLAAAFPNGLLVTASKSKNNVPEGIKVWDTNNRTLIKTLYGHKAEITAFTGTLCLPFFPLFSFELVENFFLLSFQELIKFFLNILVLSNGLLMSASKDKTIKLWDVLEGSTFLKSYDDKNDKSQAKFQELHVPLHLHALADGHVFVHDDADNVLILDPTTFIAKDEFSKCIRANRCFLLMNQSYYSNGIIATDFDISKNLKGPGFHLYDVNTCKLLATITGHAGPVTCVVALPNGVLVSGSEDSTIMFWKWGRFNTEVLFTLEGKHQKSILDLVVLPCGILCSLSLDDTIMLWDTSTYERIHTFQSPFSNSSPQSKLAVLSNGLLALVNRKSLIALYDVSHFTQTKI